ncbi:MAG: DEAD/DEAH box helicase [Methanomassiliicoccales archaeon]|nr:MAG: DEAD/DEAH box helicase [Methanomassiliicoccales archaeon]
MTINPIAFAEDVNRQFLRYQLSAFPLSDKDLSRQAEEMLGLHSARSELIKGPYISLSRSFAEGAGLDELVRAGRLHPGIQEIFSRNGIRKMYAHQQDAFDAVTSGKHCLISTGTGSGKTEAFLYPILDHCFRLKDQNARKGIVAIIVYPMNALAQDQLERLRPLLVGTGITYGMYVGSTPEKNENVTGLVKMKEGEGPEHVESYKKRYLDDPTTSFAPYEERISEEEMRDDPPRLLLTNVNQLEFLLTRGKDLGMFSDAPLKFIVFDEAHTYTGSRGAEVSVLIRRLRAFCKKTSDDVICIGTSATIVDPNDKDAARKFAHRFFGVDKEKVVLVKERYDEQDWAEENIVPDKFGEEAAGLYDMALEMVDSERGMEYASKIIDKIGTGIKVSSDWRSSLYDVLRRNGVVRSLFEIISEPKPIEMVTKELWNRLDRKDPDPNATLEVLTYLALGAAAEKDGVPLLRPQLHYFVRGMTGAVATLYIEKGQTQARLYFSKAKAAHTEDVVPEVIYPVLSCGNCGQHYFQTQVHQAVQNGEELVGEISGENTFLRVSPEGEGRTVVFTNRFVSEEEDLEDSEKHSRRLDEKRQLMYLCRHCGSIHWMSSIKCSNPLCAKKDELLPIYVIKTDNDGFVSSCPSCGQSGGRAGGKQRSPLRPLSAVQVADVHIMAQNMINSQAVDNRKLIVFADNRQDAAFQAAWMADHARRYRLRHMIYLIIKDASSPMSIGDIQRRLQEQLKKNNDLARALAPEVFVGEVEEKFTTHLDDQMKRYLRILLIRELVTSFSKSENLEGWGKAKVIYYGLDESDGTVQDLAVKYGISTTDLVLGIENLLDVFRRQGHFYDPVEPIFTQRWSEGSPDVLRGYLPYRDYPPKGLKLRREGNDKKDYITQLLSDRGSTLVQHLARKWGVEEGQITDFVEDIWSALVSKWKLLKSVTLIDHRGRPLPGSSGAYQVDSSQIGIVIQNEKFVCNICGRSHTRATPRMVCTAYNCRGHLERQEPSENDYDVSLLERDFTMLVAKEHTAQVPQEMRHDIEKEFKKSNGAVNCLVATPTLELGVDIGALDMVLMRNVPPLSSNYWQRAGRAGRRHRMAVIYTYCRKSVHDEYFFEEPMRILSGRIGPPRFNLRNPVMIEKHVHACVLTKLFEAAKADGADPKITSELSKYLPNFIRDYIIDENGKYRHRPLDTSPLQRTIESVGPEIERYINGVFKENWPLDAISEVEEVRLREYISSTGLKLAEHVKTIHRRMMWAKMTRDNLSEKEKDVVSLDEGEKRLKKRCQDYIEKITKSDLENYTLSVLAREGFLPGYTSSQGNTIGFAVRSYSTSSRPISFDLPRPNTLAVQEFVPGNIIYANGGRYKTSYYHLPLDRGQTSPDKFMVDVNKQSIYEINETPTDYRSDDVKELGAIPIGDVELAFISLVSDEEEGRFRMPVFMTGHLRNEHRGIDRYRTGLTVRKEFEHRHGQRVRLVNIGAADQVKDKNLGYPICAVCGAVRSPYASDETIKDFEKKHKVSCSVAPSRLGLYTESQVDGLLFSGLVSLDEAINLTEGIRIAAAVLLEMEVEDLQIIILPNMDGMFDVMLYDPMPGGSGLIDQIIERWSEIIETGSRVLQNCPGNCAKACYDCMKTYRNMVDHEKLDRGLAVKMLNEFKGTVEKIGSVPPCVTIWGEDWGCTNSAEDRLAAWLKQKGIWGFEPQGEITVELDKRFQTYPDFYYRNLEGKITIAIYLDGLSRNIHGNQGVKNRDRMIRSRLRSMGIEVIEIAATDLDDPRAMDLFYEQIVNAMNSQM